MIANENYPPVEVAFIDVGQGDTIVVSIPETRQAVVIDCVDAVAVFDYLRDRGVQHVCALLITHLHADHFRGAIEFLENCEAELGSPCQMMLYNRRMPPKQPHLLSDDDGHSDAESVGNVIAERQLLLQGLKVWTRRNHAACGGLEQGALKVQLPGDFADILELLHPWHADYDHLLGRGLNHTSAVFLIRGGGSRALLAGDIEPWSWAELCTRHPDLHADVLKFPHHGGWSGSQAEADSLLDAVAPSIVIMSVGTSGQQYDHPKDHVFQAIAQRKIRLLCTQATRKCGCIASDVRERVLQRLHADASALNRARVGSGSGCPCAGTIVVSLAQSAHVLQPTTPTHRDDIILTEYFTHRCVLP